MIYHVHDMLSWTWKSDYFNNNVHVDRTMEVRHLMWILWGQMVPSDRSWCWILFLNKRMRSRNLWKRNLKRHFSGGNVQNSNAKKLYIVS